MGSFGFFWQVVVSHIFYVPTRSLVFQGIQFDDLRIFLNRRNWQENTTDDDEIILVVTGKNLSPSVVVNPLQPEPIPPNTGDLVVKTLVRQNVNKALLTP